MEEFGLLIPFEDQSQNFTLGFEAGMIYQRLNQEKSFDMMIHSENLSQIQLMATRLGFFCGYELIDSTDEWVNISLKKSIERVK